MGALTLQFSPNQQHQEEAVSAVIDLLAGQDFSSSYFQGDSLEVGFGNGSTIFEDVLKDRLREVQERSALPQTNELTEGRLRDFSIEMETGTGKTYVYTRSIYELHKAYGLTKFIIVVPNVAIREGVKKSLETTRAHFDELYDRQPFESFIYDSDKMGRVSAFAASNNIEVMIINIQAFRKSFDSPGKESKANLFNRTSEKIADGRSPREVVAALNPVVIIDEPQLVDETPLAQKAIAALNPLFVLRYSATHKSPYNMLYRLTPVDAYQRGLVKQIRVDSVLAQAEHDGGFIDFESVQRKPIRAKLRLMKRAKNGVIKKSLVTIKVGDDLYVKSGHNEAYEAGWQANNIGTASGDEFIEFTNGERLALGEVRGDTMSTEIKRVQIRSTIENHFKRQEELWKEGVKVLSLFFLDKVKNYRIYNDDGTTELGAYAQMFVEEYERLLEKEWRQKLEEAGIPVIPASDVHNGYFAQDKRGRLKETTTGSAEADIDAFNLIMKDKETLLTLPSAGNPATQVSFIFSHSALSAGWDNPNVFQICTLVDTKDSDSKRQRIGRGLRLCVNQEGQRLFGANINTLTVIANESFEAFAAGLQKEFEEDGYRFGVITPESFSALVYLADTDDGVQIEQRLGSENSQAIYQALQEQEMIDETGKIAPELKAWADGAEGCPELELPEIAEGSAESIKSIIVRRAAKLSIKDKAKEVTIKIQPEVLGSVEFEELWKRICVRTKYKLHVDSEQLIGEAVRNVKGMLKIRRPIILRDLAELSVDESGVDAEAIAEGKIEPELGLRRVYPDPISEIQDRVGLTRKTIKRILKDSGRFDEFLISPRTYIEQVVAQINRAKDSLLSRGIQYERLGEDEYYTMDILDTGSMTAYLGDYLIEPSELQNPEKTLYDYIVVDSLIFEKDYAFALDRSGDCLTYMKLPSSFTVDTPLGSYNPDWAYVEKKNDDSGLRVYFVTETKGGTNADPSMRDTERGKTECARAHFEAIGTGIEYEVRSSYR